MSVYTQRREQEHGQSVSPGELTLTTAKKVSWFHHLCHRDFVSRCLCWSEHCLQGWESVVYLEHGRVPSEEIWRFKRGDRRREGRGRSEVVEAGEINGRERRRRNGEGWGGTGRVKGEGWRGSEWTGRRGEKGKGKDGEEEDGWEKMRGDSWIGKKEKLVKEADLSV